MKVTVKTPVRKTESFDRVKKALLNIFPELEVELIKEKLAGKTDNLDKFKELLRNQKIRSTARGLFLKNKRGSELRFQLNKQAAWVGKLNFTEEPQPLGSIQVIIENRNLDGIIDDLTKIE